jgi:hypothetical protein
MKVIAATVPTLTGIGIVSLAVSRNQRRPIAGRLALGPMWIVAGVNPVMDATFTMIAGIPVFFAIPAGAGRLHPETFMAAALLGVMPLWTGVTYPMQARVLTDDQIARFGRQITGKAALAGVLTVMSRSAARLPSTSGSRPRTGARCDASRGANHAL